jgi:hypothetical protein
VTLHDYLGYRLAGCTHRGAANRVQLALGGIASPDCPAKPSPGTLPPTNETLEFMRELEQVRRAQGEPETTTYVDLEGEAVWMQTYVDYRLQGCTPHAASDAVLRTIQGGGTPRCR